MAKENHKARRDKSLIYLAMRALLLLIVLPACVVLYLFKDNLQGKSVALALVMVLAVIGFYIMWTVINAIRLLQQDLKLISEGKATSLETNNNLGQLSEMGEIIQALNKLTQDFRENASQLEKFINQFAALTELTEITANVPSIEDLLGMVLKKATLATNARIGSVMLLDDTGRELWLVATEGWVPKDNKPILTRRSFAAGVIDSGEPLRIEDIQQAEITHRANDTSRYKSPSFIIMPLKSKTQAIGVVCLSDKTTGAAFSPQDQQFLAVMLAQIGFAVENAKLLQQARDAAYQLKQKVEDKDLQLQDAEMKFTHVEKLSALGQLAGGVAHDFNNLIQAIQGYTRFAMKGLEEDDPRLADLNEVVRAADRAASLTRQLLAFGRRQVLQRMDINLNSIIEETVRMLSHVIGVDVKLDVVPGEKLGIINADPSQVEQVLMNLCLNARDAMPDGGKLVIQTSNVVLDKEFCQNHPDCPEGNYVKLMVSDTGCGMAEDVCQKVFQPFFTTKEFGKGSGLGLATAYGIIKQHDAIVDVHSDIGEGTTFEIYFPVIDRPAEKEEREARGDSQSGTETILVAEDEEIVASFATRCLREAGYTVLLATDGNSAVSIFSENADTIGLSLVDVVMPGLGGKMVCQEIRKINPDMPVLFTSGYTSSERTAELELDSITDIIPKPYQPQSLLRRIRLLLDRRTNRGKDITATAP